MSSRRTIRLSWTQLFKVSNISADDLNTKQFQKGTVKVWVTPHENYVKMVVKEYRPNSRYKRESIEFTMPKEIWESMIKHYNAFQP